MKLEVLDLKVLDGKVWTLCKGNLLEYLEGLRTNFFEFSVQRKIVNNVYLDDIYRSVEKGIPFPPITLTYSGSIPKDNKRIEIEGNKVEILDGLQRTYRLWVILFFDSAIKRSHASDLKSLATYVKETEEGEAILQNNFVTPKFIKALFNVVDGELYVEKLVRSYSDFDVYFNIWSGLDDQEVVRRMLVLNAGQKAVSSTHQFELLFLHFFENNKLDYNRNIVLVREKDKDFRRVQRGDRTENQFLMSSVVIALQSFINGKQLRVSPANLINLDDNKLLNEENLEGYFNPKSLSSFIDNLYSFGIDLSVKSHEYVKWYGKDTALSGIFGAMGAYLIDTGRKPSIDLIVTLKCKLINGDGDPFKLSLFYDAYENNIASSKVNVGNVVRKAIFDYTKNLLCGNTPNWDKCFSPKEDYD